MRLQMWGCSSLGGKLYSRSLFVAARARKQAPLARVFWLRALPASCPPLRCLSPSAPLASPRRAPPLSRSLCSRFCSGSTFLRRMRDLRLPTQRVEQV